MTSSLPLPTYGFNVNLMMEERSGTWRAVTSERTALAFPISQYLYGENRGLNLIAAEWFLMGPADK